MSAEGQGLSADDLARLEEIRKQMQEAMNFVSTLANGGWNHGPRVVYAAAELLDATAEATGSVEKLAVESREAGS
jgi:hypothetical protein